MAGGSATTWNKVTSACSAAASVPVSRTASSIKCLPPLQRRMRESRSQAPIATSTGGAAGCISPAGTDNNEIVFFGGGFAEYLGSRLTHLDRGLELDAGSSQNVSLLIESSSEWLFVTRIFRDAQERDPGLGRAGQ